MIEELKKQIATVEADLKKNEDECKRLRGILNKHKKTLEIYEQGVECGSQVMAMYNGLKTSGMPDDLAREFILNGAGITK